MKKSFGISFIHTQLYEYPLFTYANIYLHIFLIRRARENGGMLSKLKTEKTLLRKEMLSRLATGRIVYTPKGDYVPVGFEKNKMFTS